MELPRSSPARLVASATLKLPRWALFALCLAYILPGLVGRDPWKTEDATGFGMMWTMAHGSLRDWFMPNVVGAPIWDSGPLMGWFGAIAIRALHVLPESVVDEALAARTATVILFLVTALALWYGTYLLGRRPAAQPLALAFGGQPDERDYGRTLADGSLLILVATLGLAPRIHGSAPEVAVLASLCVCFYGLSRALDQPWRAMPWLVAGFTGTAFSAGPIALGSEALLAGILLVAHPEWKSARLPFLLGALPSLAVILLAWYSILVTLPAGGRWFDLQLHYWMEHANGMSADAARRMGRNLPWFTLPAWPLAVWALWSWRREAASAHVVLPVGMVLAMVAVLASSSDTSDGLALMLLPGLVVLAAFALPTLKRGGANAIDWGSLIVFSLVGLGLWISWGTRMLGVPRQYANTLARLVPGLPNDFHVLPFAFALVTTVAWLAMVRWRIVSHPKVLWRSVVLAGGGLTLCWALIMTLWIGEINYSRTYRDVALRLALAEPATRQTGACVNADGLGLAQRASFAYFAHLQFAVQAPFGPRRDCPYLLRQDLARAPREDIPAGPQWRLVWDDRRASDRDERYRLYRQIIRRAPKAALGNENP